MDILGVAPRAFVPLAIAKVREVEVKRVAASSFAAAAVALPAQRALIAPPTIPHGISLGEAPATGWVGSFSGMNAGVPGEIGAAATVPRVSVANGGGGEGRRGPVRVSSGVGAGMLMAPIRPVYPSIARAARVEGTVVVEAVISPEGHIERARVVSGPAMLAGAALDAVKGARYSPFRLNGVAIEVETTARVEFRLGG